MKRIMPLLIVVVLAGSCQESGSPAFDDSGVGPIPEVVHTGEMRDVMHKGKLAGVIDLDTIAGKKHLYAVGPVEYLRGEITILDGECYVSRVESDSVLHVEKTFGVKAPFFVSSSVETWYETALPDSVRDLRQLEVYLDMITRASQRPFAFKLTATADSADIHVVNLPEGTDVHSPEEAHRGQQNYRLADATVELVGFFSTDHAGVFIHHDRFVHVHLITADRSKMGHLDAVWLKTGTAQLYLPQPVK